MRFHPYSATDVAATLLERSICSVQVAAVLLDNHGIFAWGWNNPGSGYGEHAEAMCMRRANRERVGEAVMYVAAKRRKSGNIITSKPCPHCQHLIRKVGGVIWRDADGEWRLLT